MTATHLAPDGKTRHDGHYATCPRGVCENDRDPAEGATEALTIADRMELGLLGRHEGGAA